MDLKINNIGLNSISRKRICFLLPWFATYRFDFFRLLESTYASRYDIFVLHGQKPSDKVINYSKPKDIKSKGLLTVERNLFGYKLTWQKGLFAEIKKNRPEIFIMLFNPGTLNYLIITIYAKMLKIPFAFWVCGWRRPELVGFHLNFRDIVYERFLKLADLLISYSSSYANDLRKDGFDSRKIIVAQNTINIERIVSSTVTRDKKQSRIQIGINDDDFIFLFVGGIVKEKNLLNAINAIMKYNFHENKIQFIIVGNGPEKESIIEFIHSNSINNVKLVGALHGEELRPYFESADVFLLPGDGGLAVNEAMAYGLPIISAIGDGTITDLVEDNVNGYLLNQGSPEEIEMTIGKILALDKKRLIEMGHASHKIIIEKGTLQNMVEQFNKGIEILNSKNQLNLQKCITS